MKQTEIGFIPDDWEVKKLGDLAFVTKLAGFEFTAHVKYSDLGKIIALRGLNVRKGFLILDDVKYIDDSNFSKLDRSRLFIDDLLFTYVGTVGNAALVDKDNTYYLAPNVALIRCNKHIHPKFLMYLILSKSFFDKQISTLMSTTSQAALSMTNIRLFRIPLPPFAEQQRIAKALSDVDTLISTTEKLIQKKKNIKQGAMQNLLTGKKRLPGFGPQTKSPAYKQTELGPIPEDWEVKSLCSYASLITKGTTPTSIGDNFTDSCIKFIKIESLTSDYKIDLSRIAYISESTHKRLYRSELKRNDLLISIAGALGKTAIVESNVLPANTNQALAIVRLSDNNLLNIHFLLYWINSKIIQEMIKDMSVTGAQPNISLKNINDLPIIIPSKEEQNAIVNILSSMDKEIITLNKKLEKYRNLKTAMMQQLLTGKIRLV